MFVMADHSGSTPYLSLEEIEGEYKEALKKFEKIKRHYSKSRVRRWMGKRDAEALYNCIRNLIPLNGETSVKEQTLETISLDKTLFYRINRLVEDITKYMAGFRNTGIPKSGIELISY